MWLLCCLGAKMTQMVPFDEAIVAASILDPFVMLCMEDGTVTLLRMDHRTRDVTVEVVPSQINASFTLSDDCVRPRV
jgi:hypothetical protein